MIYGLYHSTAGMLTTEYRQAVISNNLANTDTVGFKRDIATFAERLPAELAGRRYGPSAEGMAGLSGGLWLGRTCTDFTAAEKLVTNNPLDVSLDGPGFLAVESGGQVLYTRDGRLQRNPEGLLVSAADGAPVLGQGGVPIRVNPVGGELGIDGYGRVTQDGGIVGQLELLDFPDYGSLVKVGDTRFTGPDEEAVPAAALVQSGYLEAAGVQPVAELVDMMEASRAYQINARMVSMQDETAGRLISTIART